MLARAGPQPNLPDLSNPPDLPWSQPAANRSIRAHSASDTGMTDRREIRTSAKSLNAGSALISASVTGRRSFFTGTMSTTACLPLASFGSG